MAFIGDPELRAKVSCDLCGDTFLIGPAKGLMVFNRWESCGIYFNPCLGDEKYETATNIKHACLPCRTTVKEKFEAIIAEMRKVEVPNEPS